MCGIIYVLVKALLAIRQMRERRYAGLSINCSTDNVFSSQDYCENESVFGKLVPRSNVILYNRWVEIYINLPQEVL